MLFFSLLVASSAIVALVSSGLAVAPKTYKCISGKCELQSALVALSSEVNSDLMSQATCLLTCDGGYLWPYPTGDTIIRETHAPILADSLKHAINIEEIDLRIRSIIASASNELQRSVDAKVLKRSVNVKQQKSAHFSIKVTISDPSVSIMNLHVDESYSLNIQPINNEKEDIVVASISAATAFGVRHALETLSQLIAWEPYVNSFVIASDVRIVNDSPQFPYRGLMLDVSRQFLSLQTLQQMIVAMVGC